ncbi:hypothetical protein WJX75_008195 [Coccomyxa subellipsoidea]|uniref:Uncharacterized protein n=1 Tax=Coccomyxa subellipsoidea TaxID=248742 RepID=A0ABR2YQ36_9CHLO
MVSMSTGSAQYMIVVYASICAVTGLQVLRLICLLSIGLPIFTILEDCQRPSREAALIGCLPCDCYMTVSLCEYYFMQVSLVYLCCGQPSAGPVPWSSPAPSADAGSLEADSALLISTSPVLASTRHPQQIPQLLFSLQGHSS